MDSSEEIAIKPSLKPLASLGRDEMNLAEFPISLLTDRVPKDQNVAVYQDEIHDERTGLTLTRKLTITAGNQGLTTAADDDVILSLIQLTREKNNFTNRRVEFSRHELVQRLGWTVGGASYDRLLLSLKRWTSVFLQYENAWRDNRTKTWTTAGFHIIDKYEITDTRSTGGQLELLPSFIVWGEDIFESFQAGYLKPLDYDLCMGLRNSTAKRMYRFLDKRFYNISDISFDLKLFAHAHIGLGDHYEGPAHLKRTLQPAIQELEKIGFLEPLKPSDRFIKNGKEWRIRLSKRADSPALLPPKSPPNADTPMPPVVTDLVERGVSRLTAADLVQRHAASLIHEKLDVFDWLVGKGDKRVAKSPAGYLVKSITDDYAKPKGFISKADLEKQAETKRNASQQTDTERRRKHEAEAIEKAIRQEILTRRKRLTKDDLAQLEAQAIAGATDELRQSVDSTTEPEFRRMLIGSITDDYLRRLIEAEKMPEPA
jgi:hypothetical protein